MNRLNRHLTPTFKVMAVLASLMFHSATLLANDTSELIKAAKNGNLDKVYEYLAKNSNINGRNNSGRTALIQAANSENANAVKIVELLLAAGSDINATDNKGNTALILAAKIGNASIVQLLLSKGANSELKNNSGYTALDQAEEKNRYTTINILKLGGNYTVALALYIDIRNKSIDPKKFQDAAIKAYKRRRWNVIKTEDNVVVATLSRRNLAYQSRFILENNNVIIRYDYGFGGNNFKYLNNLKSTFLSYLK